jgi:iron only hydrogenase large subunit-like protein
MKNFKLQVNDHISPSVECIKPLPKPTEYEVFKEPLKISLTDCLACSGCITSAESILVEMQNVPELYKAYQNTEKKYKYVVITLSPQTLTSFLTKYSVFQGVKEIWLRIKYLFEIVIENPTGLKIIVLDSSFSRNFSLLEIGCEFISRYRSTQGDLPLLASSCPAFICFAEKTASSVLLPYISTSKSPQQVMGSLVKDYLSSLLNVEPQEIFHCSIMPCFDKKLESSREDFIVDGVKDVDLVISTLELETIIHENVTSIYDLQESSVKESLFPTLLRSPGSSSGGYLHHVLYFALEHFYPKQEFQVKEVNGKNSDFKEFVAYVNGTVVFTFATAYGFRNIQNVLRILKNKSVTRKYDFIEIMACPMGCINGGAQLRPDGIKGVVALKEFVKGSEYLYQNSFTLGIPQESEVVSRLYNDWIGGEVGSAEARKKLHTRYHAVGDSGVSTLVTQW